MSNELPKPAQPWCLPSSALLSVGRRCRAAFFVARGFFNLDPGIMLEVIKLNTIGTLIPCQVFGRDMARQGRGSIVNFASMNSYRPLSKNLAYSLSKAGVVNSASSGV